MRSEEWARLRALRLAALAAAPTAYGSTLAAEQAYPDELWRERAAGAASGLDRSTFIADQAGIWVGMATGLRDTEVPNGKGRLLVAMFIDGSVRRLGIGRRLVDVVVDWARGGQAEQIALWVTSSNDAAVALYCRCQFSFTGRAKPHAHVEGLSEHEMRRQLCPPVEGKLG